MLDTFGRERLASGSGVLDIAGGKGELAFELLNLNGIPATVVEPRALKLAKQEVWLKVSCDLCLAHQHKQMLDIPLASSVSQP